jgi:hypothetical protein
MSSLIGSWWLPIVSLDAKHAQTNIGRHEPAYKQLDAKMNQWEIYDEQAVSAT